MTNLTTAWLQGKDCGCTLDGITSKETIFYVCDDFNSLSDTQKESETILVIDKKCLSHLNHYRAHTAKDILNNRINCKEGSLMAGGNKVKTSDGVIISVHDRFESWELYNAMSN